MDYRDIITTEPDKMGGKACVRHLQIAVLDVLDYLHSGKTEAEILADFRDLTSEDIRACIAFAGDRIGGVRDITAENPSAEVWKYLRFFLDKAATAKIIRGLHGIPPDIQTKNIAKQSQQIGFCIRQAEQYFKASAEVGLPTGPVLLYYGALSLSHALVLLKNDGTYSLDARRKGHKHNHHGLELRRGLAEDAARAASPQSFLERIECSCHFRDNRLWGHFPLFYRSLVPPAITIHAQIFSSGKTSFLEHDFPMNSTDVLSLDSIASRNLNAWELFKGLPDLYYSLWELETTPNLCRGSVKRQINHFGSPRTLNAGAGDPTLSQNCPPDRLKYQDAFFVDGIRSDQKETLLDFYREKNPSIRVVDDYGSNLHLSLSVEGPDERSVYKQIGYYPDIIEDLTGRKYFILQPANYVPEPAAFLALLFCFSMLCRYYPDIWMKNIDENVRMAELMNVFLNTAFRKFPNLILDQLTRTKHYIHP